VTRIITIQIASILILMDQTLVEGITRSCVKGYGVIVSSRKTSASTEKRCKVPAKQMLLRFRDVRSRNEGNPQHT